MDKILELKDYCITYLNRNADNMVYAVRNISFEIDRGDSLGIVGESGSGKSSLALGMLGLLPEEKAVIQGRALFDDQDLSDMSVDELNRIRWAELAVVFQNSLNALSPVHKIRIQAEDIYRVHHPKASKKEIENRFIYLLELLNLSVKVYDLYPHQLSGGMLQRVSVALSLIHQPKLLIMDEATTALDAVTRGQILDEISDLSRKMNLTRIIITHDMSVVAASCNKIAVMYAGELLETGPVRSVLKKPRHPYTEALLDAYPGSNLKTAELQSIKGNLPNMSHLNQACIFEPRCQHAKGICRLLKPMSTETPEGGMVKCYLNSGGENE